MKGPELTRRGFLVGAASLVVPKPSIPLYSSSVSETLQNIIPRFIPSVDISEAGDLSSGIMYYLLPISDRKNIFNLDSRLDKELVEKTRQGFKNIGIDMPCISNGWDLSDWITHTFENNLDNDNRAREQVFQSLPNNIQSFFYDSGDVQVWFNDNYIEDSIEYFTSKDQKAKTFREGTFSSGYFRGKKKLGGFLIESHTATDMSFCYVEISRDSGEHIELGDDFSPQVLNILSDVLKMDLNTLSKFFNKELSKKYRKVRKNKRLRKFLLSTTSHTPISHYTKTTVESILDATIPEIEKQKIKMLLSSVIEVYTRS